MKYSKNIVNNKVYEIPEILDDSKNIESFLSKHHGKKVIVVQGLGFVGAVMSLVCANSITEDYAVIGIDLPSENSYWKIKSINDGIFPLIAEDPKIGEFFEKAIQKENFYATYDPCVFEHADVVIVDINLDVQKESNKDYSLASFDVDMSGFKAAIKSIAEKCREDILILVETTVPPGTCEKIVKPIMRDELSKRGLNLDAFKLGHSYERVMPGPEYINSIREYPRVYSGMDQNSADSIQIFLSTIIDINLCDLTRLEHTNATEMAKVLENSYRASNIAFAVEWSRYAEEAGVDLFSIVNAIRVRDTHSNLMYPGIGVGGYCLTKDPLLASWSRKSFFGSEDDLSMSIKSVSTNDQMPRYAFERLLKVFHEISNKNILMLGVSYRGDVGDTRFSPAEGVYNMIQENGSTIFLHDPFVKYWPELDLNVESKLDDVLDNELDIIIISAGHNIYKSSETIEKLMNIKNLKIFDTLGLFSDEQINTLKSKHELSILGRGDIK
tara:strand:- start:2916 stop:4409 length:1494 start_codon:yes stop_codon:yes gene_type:complete